jgi:hypothetical protein
VDDLRPLPPFLPCLPLRLAWCWSSFGVTTFGWALGAAEPVTTGGAG